MGTGELNAGGNPAMDWHPIQGGVEIFLVASGYGNRNKLRPNEPLDSYANFTYLYLEHNRNIQQTRKKIHTHPRRNAVGYNSTGPQSLAPPYSIS